MLRLGIFQGSSVLLIGRGGNDDKGGIQIPIVAGDVIVLPAGTSHCSLESSVDYRYIGVYVKASTSTPWQQPIRLVLWPNMVCLI